MSYLENYLDDLEEYVLGKTWSLTQEKIFNDIVNFIYIENDYVTEEEFIKSLSNAISEYNINDLVKMQKNYFKDVIYEFVKQYKSLESYSDIILQVNDDDFWRVRVNKISDKIKEYIKEISQKIMKLENLDFLEPVIQKLKKSIVKTPNEDIVFRTIIECVDKKVDKTYFDWDPNQNGCKDSESEECEEGIWNLGNMIENYYIEDNYKCVKEVSAKCGISENIIENMFDKILNLFYNEGILMKDIEYDE